ncbi:30S ribosomal protein S8 [Candidatus Woesearchaeota archaeon]|nr:30S ribosomal protein S8 [Candidatus Woesearchaeota archaeon]
MAMNDPLAAVFAQIYNSEIKGKEECLVRLNSIFIQKVLNILKLHNYIGDFELINKERGGVLKIILLGNINKCNVIKPRYAVSKNNFEKYEKRYLPAKGFGIIIVSTSKGLMTHEEAIEKKIGGKLIAYCY